MLSIGLSRMARSTTFRISRLSPLTPCPSPSRGEGRFRTRTHLTPRLPLRERGLGVRAGRWWIPFVALLLVPLLSGCLLISGEQTMIDLSAGTGNLSTTFVGAEGGEERTVKVSAGAATLRAIVMISLATGDLQIDLLQPDGSLAFAVTSQPDAQVTRSNSVRSDANGLVRYRVSARSARNGEFQIFFQP